MGKKADKTESRERSNAADHVRLCVGKWERLYRTRKNPRFAWLAYGLCRGAGVPPPAWVLKYFDQVEQNLFVIDRPTEGEIASKVAAAVGFVPGGAEFTFQVNLDSAYGRNSNLMFRGKGGRFNPFGRLDERDLMLSEAVEALERSGLTRTQAKAKVAKSYGSSVKTIENALRRFPHTARK